MAAGVSSASLQLGDVGQVRRWSEREGRQLLPLRMLIFTRVANS